MIKTIIVDIGDYQNILVHRDCHRRDVVAPVFDHLRSASSSCDAIDISELCRRDPTTIHIRRAVQVRPDGAHLLPDGNRAAQLHEATRRYVVDLGLPNSVVQMVRSTHTIAVMMDIDLQAYEEPTLVALYSRSVDLQLPEATLFERLLSKLGGMDVLDLGVGAGRTSLHFAPVAKSYLGVDYSQAMIEACSRRMPGVRFLLADARSMDFAADFLVRPRPVQL